METILLHNLGKRIWSAVAFIRVKSFPLEESPANPSYSLKNISEIKD